MIASPNPFIFSLFNINILKFLSKIFLLRNTFRLYIPILHFSTSQYTKFSIAFFFNLPDTQLLHFSTHF